MIRAVVRRVVSLVPGVSHAISCREFEAFLVDYLEDELAQGPRRVFEFHIRVCAECRAYLDAYKASVTLGAQAFDEPETDVPASVPEALVAAVLAARGHRSDET